MSAEDIYEVTAEAEPFIMVPLWLLEASPNAFKLYAILKRYANNRTNEAWPSRATLADHMGYKQAKTLDPIIKELEGIGAVRVKRSAPSARRAVNVYHLATARPFAAVAPENGHQASGPGKRTTPVVRSGDFSGSFQRRLVDPENGHELKTKNYNQGTKDLPPTAVDGEAEAAEEPEPKGPTGYPMTTQGLIAEWIDHCDPRPLPRVIGIMSREIKNCLTAGADFLAVRAGVAEVEQKGLNPSTLQSVVHALHQRRAVAMQPAGNYNRTKVSTGTQRAMDAIAAGQRLQEQIDTQQGTAALEHRGGQRALGEGVAGGQQDSGRSDDSGVVGNPQPFRFS